MGWPRSPLKVTRRTPRLQDRGRARKSSAGRRWSLHAGGAIRRKRMVPRTDSPPKPNPQGPVRPAFRKGVARSERTCKARLPVSPSPARFSCACFRRLTPIPRMGCGAALRIESEPSHLAVLANAPRPTQRHLRCKRAGRRNRSLDLTAGCRSWPKTAEGTGQAHGTRESCAMVRPIARKRGASVPAPRRLLPCCAPMLALHQPLVHHRVGDLEEPRNVGAVHQIPRRAVLLRRLERALVDRDHDLVEALIHLLARP